MKGKLQQRTAKKRNTTSLFVWVWGAISLLCLRLLLVFSFSQGVVVKQTFKYQLGQDLSMRGHTVKTQILAGRPAGYDTDEAFAQHLSTTYGVSIAVLDGEGQVAYSAGADRLNFAEEIVEIKKRLTMAEETGVSENTPSIRRVATTPT